MKLSVINADIQNLTKPYFLDKLDTLKKRQKNDGAVNPNLTQRNFKTGDLGKMQGNCEVLKHRKTSKVEGNR
jgi:hypothetical protein